jgi:hypothetical protein
LGEEEEEEEEDNAPHRPSQLVAPCLDRRIRESIWTHYWNNTIVSDGTLV